MLGAAFKEMLLTPDNSPGSRPSKQDHIARLQADPKQRLSTPNLDNPRPPVINSPAKDKGSKGKHGADKHQIMSTGHKTKIRKALQKFNFLPRNVNR